jgi:hypothetical protein
MDIIISRDCITVQDMAKYLSLVAVLCLMLIGLAFAVSAIDSSTHEEASNSEDVAVDDVVSQEELGMST